MEVGHARVQDIEAYTAFARHAQEWLEARGYRQYVPAAHQEYADELRASVAAGTLYAVRDKEELVGFFKCDLSASRWWPSPQPPAVYVSGIVVSPAARRRGVGSYIIERCVAEAVRLQRQFIRLDCHADNVWLRRYYEDRGFVLRGELEQYPGYFGCLYERAVACVANDPSAAEQSSAEQSSTAE